MKLVTFGKISLGIFRVLTVAKPLIFLIDILFCFLILLFLSLQLGRVFLALKTELSWWMMQRKK